MRKTLSAKYILEYSARNSAKYGRNRYKKYPGNRPSKWFFDDDIRSVTPEIPYHECGIFSPCIRRIALQSCYILQTTKPGNSRRNSSRFWTKSHFRYFSRDNRKFLSVFLRCKRSPSLFSDRKSRSTVQKTKKHAQHPKKNIRSHLYRWGLSYDTRIL